MDLISLYPSIKALKQKQMLRLRMPNTFNGKYYPIIGEVEIIQFTLYTNATVAPTAMI